MIGGFWQGVHNLVAHPLMVILPEPWGTRFHDWTAAKAWPENKP